MNRTDRLMAMLWLLRTRELMTAAELGSAFSISERSVYRDIAALSEAGVPVVALPGPGGGYTLMKEYAITPLAFTDQEAVALLLGAKFVAGIESPFDQAASTAADKIHRALPERQSRRVAQWLSVLRPALPVRSLPLDDTQLFTDALEAAAAAERVALTYTDVEGRLSERVVEPHRITFANGAWYLEGFCLQRQDIRRFRLDRVRSLRRTGELFTPRPLAAEADEKVEVLLAMPPHHQDWYRSHPLFGPHVTGCDQDRVALSLPRGLLSSLLSALLWAGNRERLLSPEWLRQELLTAARGVLEQYEES